MNMNLTDLRDIKNQLLIYPLTEYKDLKYYNKKLKYTETDVNLFQKPFIMETFKQFEETLNAELAIYYNL